MNKLFLIALFQVFLLCLCRKVVCQSNYFEYHKQIHIAEEHTGLEQFSQALDIYDVVFAEYDYVFVKDFLIAAQIALLIDSTQKVSYYLEQAIINGYPCKCVERNPIFKDYISFNTWLSIESKEKEYQKNYHTKIRTDLLIEFSKRFRNEQETKSDDNLQVYKTHVISNFERVKSLMDSLVFPSDRIIGLDKSIFAPFNYKENVLSECSAGNAKVIVTLLHYDNPITDIGIDKFIKAIELGYLHPGEFAAIFNFEKNNISRITKNINVNKANLPDYEFSFQYNLSPEESTKINLDRARFGMNTLETRQRLIDASMKFGFRVNFDYKVP